MSTVAGIDIGPTTTASLDVLGLRSTGLALKV
jgi:hypothetical protein